MNNHQIAEVKQTPIEQTNMLVFLSAEDIAYLRMRQAKHFHDTLRGISLPALVQMCVKEAAISEAMGEKAEASCSTK